MSRRSIGLFVLGGAALVASCIPGAIAVRLAWWGDDDWVDVEPTDLADSTEIRHGDLVWLRGERDRSHRVTLADGRVLYPTVEDPRVMVECGADDCAGSPIGAVEDLHVSEPSPAGWPAGTGRHVRVVRVGEPSAGARRTATQVAFVTVALLGVAVGCGAAGTLLVLRRRPRA